MPTGKTSVLFKKLKDNSKIAHYSFFNGSIRVKMGKDEDAKMIWHVNDLAKLTNMSRTEIENLAL